ncbi:MAG: hypothetical protein KUG77_07325, partial [Nannocystaceae bacterium]|nr:hypothetical protein [Nannocystaceae bacterium]
MTTLRPELLTEADALPTDIRLQLGVPLHVLLGEATDLAAYVRRVWARTEHHPGLSSAARHIDASISGDLIALVEAVQTEHTAFRLAAEPPVSREVVERAEAVLDELTAVLEFHLDDGVQDERDAGLAALADLYGTRTRSDDALAAALFDFSALADSLRAELDGLGGFEPAVIDEARQLAEQVRQRSARSPSELAENATAHRIRRDQLATVLDHKVKLVRAAARFAFRGHASLARESGSVYGRRVRAARRRAASQAAVALGESGAQEVAG